MGAISIFCQRVKLDPISIFRQQVAPPSNRSGPLWVLWQEPISLNLQNPPPSKMSAVGTLGSRSCSVPQWRGEGNRPLFRNSNIRGGATLFGALDPTPYSSINLGKHTTLSGNQQQAKYAKSKLMAITTYSQAKNLWLARTRPISRWPWLRILSISKFGDRPTIIVNCTDISNKLSGGQQISPIPRQGGCNYII